MSDGTTRSRFLLLALLLLSAPALAAEARRPPIDLQGVRVVDLTYSFDERAAPAGPCGSWP
ncbi:MAG TPA: hypothetical protein VKM72_20125 [Thermoanaerobaculia bacterium]|nr:hypothetical protein [Thermoanaerobaculia bacterium]